MNKVAITGYLSIDTLVHGAATSLPLPGGAALYAALGAARAGADVALHASVGPDWQADWRIAMNDAGIATDRVAPLDHPTRRTRLIYGDAPRQSPHFKDADWLAATQAHMPKAVLEDCDVIVATPMPVAALALVIQAAHGRKVVADTSEWVARNDGAELLGLIPQLYVFAPSREETRLLYPDLTDDDALRRLAGSGPITVQKRGADGVVIADGDRLQHLPATAVTAVDPTGAGDAFVGALAAGLAAGRTPISAAQHALTIAARAVSAMGPAGLGISCAPTRKDVR